MYSAVKHKGQPLYKLARAGIDVERKSRTVKIHRLEIITWQPPEVTLDIECSKGTYIRSLAHDLGQLLGCGAYLKSLVRTRCGIFDIKDAISITQLEEACRRGDWQQFLHPIDSVLQDLQEIVVDEAGEEAVRTGSPVTMEQSDVQNDTGDAGLRYGRAYNREGRFLGILQRNAEKGTWQPKKVMI
jgi:tRNA pseudouridine55 synthase